MALRWYQTLVYCCVLLPVAFSIDENGVSQLEEDDECRGDQSSQDCAWNALQFRAKKPASSSVLDEENWFQRITCIANFYYNRSQVEEATQKACHQMGIDCSTKVKPKCRDNPWFKATYVFGKYFREFGANENACKHLGAGVLADYASLNASEQTCAIRPRGRHHHHNPLTSSWKGDAQDKPISCASRRDAGEAQLVKAVSWACGVMKSFDCGSQLPNSCSQSIGERADYVFGKYFEEFGAQAGEDCNFGGAGTYIRSSDLPSRRQECLVHLDYREAAKPVAPDVSTQPAQQPTVSERPPPQTRDKLPSLDEASVTHYARWRPQDRAELAGGCMPSKFYASVVSRQQSLRQESGVEAWFQAAAPIWMTQPMHGRNSAAGQGAVGTATAWFDSGTKKPHLPNGPATGMMFAGGQAVDGYDTSDGCWEASWDDANGKSHRVGLTVIDNCGHSDGVQNTVHNIKWCVPFEFTREDRGATCPIDYFNKCFPEKQSSNFGEHPHCESDGAVIGKLKVTNDANFAKMVIGTYTEDWCPEPGDKANCEEYASTDAAEIKNHSISWSGKGSARFHSEGRCQNPFLGNQEMPELGSCSPNVKDEHGRCRNAYGFPFHFDIATYSQPDGRTHQPPWGETNTRVYGVKRVQCPKSIQEAVLDSCGKPDMFIGNNLDFGHADRSYLPPSFCGTTLHECLGSSSYSSSTRAYLASTFYSFCHSHECQEIHRTVR